MSQKLEFLEGKILVEQNEVSVLFSQKEQITITILVCICLMDIHGTK